MVPQAERAVPLQEEVLAAPDDQEGLGDLETNDLMQFAYQIATGMVSRFDTELKRIQKLREGGSRKKKTA